MITSISQFTNFIQMPKSEKFINVEKLYGLQVAYKVIEFKLINANWIQTSLQKTKRKFLKIFSSANNVQEDLFGYVPTMLYGLLPQTEIYDTKHGKASKIFHVHTSQQLSEANLAAKTIADHK